MAVSISYPIRAAVVCPTCKTSFNPKSGRQRCCSRVCARHLDWETRQPKETLPTSNGYVWRHVKNHPHAIQLHKKMRPGHGYILEHRFVMEQALGRILEPHERVHHKNGDRADNRVKSGHERGGCPPECCNLELWKIGTKDPAGVRARDYHCPGCTCGGL